jgi:hypothetical protein
MIEHRSNIFLGRGGGAMGHLDAQGDLMPYFRDLGSRLEREWLHSSYDEEIFPRLALDHLTQDPPLASVAPDDVVDWFFHGAHVVQQPDQRDLFGQPPIVVFQAPRFYIEALFWFSATTSIHEHSFSGAFSVLAGSSVHSHWRFERERTINSRLLCGRLARLATEILRPGDARCIRPGAQLIHQLFHLEVPSITIVVRTYVDRNNLPQYAYLPPGLAIDAEDRDPALTRRLILLDAMAQGQLGGFERYCAHSIAHDGIEDAYRLFSLLSRHPLEKAVIDALYAAARARHGEVVDLIAQVCAWERRTQIVTSLRAETSDPEARFLLALLMLMPNRDAVFETIRLQFPALEPLAVVEAGLQKLSGRNGLGFELNELSRVLLRGLVEGLDMEGLLSRLKERFKSESVAEHADRLTSQVKELARSELLFPLLSESPLRQG